MNPRYTRPDGSQIRILVVDDQQVLADLLAQTLRHEGWRVETAADGFEAVRIARSFEPDAVVLDVMMPRMDGLETLERLRKQDPQVPVLFLTAKDAPSDRVAGLRHGGDDYVTKPFDLDEVIARIEALLRRRGMTGFTPDSEELLECADLTMNVQSHEVNRAGREIQLTATEFQLLRLFMENPNVVLSKAKILDRVWSYDYDGQANIVELYIGYLRRKLDPDNTAAPLIHTIRGAGYILRRPRV